MCLYGFHSKGVSLNLKLILAHHLNFMSFILNLIFNESKLWGEL